MNSEIIKAKIEAKIEVHAGEARRLMQHPLVGEFNIHAQRVNELQAELKALTDKEASEAKPAPEAKSKSRRKKEKNAEPVSN